MKAMIQDCLIVVVTREPAHITDALVLVPVDRSIKIQRKEVDEMKALIQDLERK